MNVYEKLNQARIQFQGSNIKMSGKNSYAGYSYYELSDILPVTNQICANLKAACIVRYEKDIAYLDFVDCEKPEDKITFSSPMSEANLKGCHAVQNLGAVETYVKRYLYQACFEIVESDALDMTMNPNQKPAQKPQQQPQTPVQTVQNAFNGTVVSQQPTQQSNEAKQLYDLGLEVSNLLKTVNVQGYPLFNEQEAEEWKAASQEKYKAKDLDGLKDVCRQLKDCIARKQQPQQPQQEIF